MTYDPLKHHRRSTRLQGYDYAQSGVYAISIVTQDRTCLFGAVVAGAMHPNAAGQMVHAVWEDLSTHYPGVIAGDFIVMPNHIHGLITLVGVAPRGRPGLPDRPGLPGHPDLPGHPEPSGRPDLPDRPEPPPAANNRAAGDGPGSLPAAVGQEINPSQAEERGQARGPAPTELGLADVVHRFKTLTTKRYVDGVKQFGWEAFRGRLWQRNYYERIIRDDAEMDRARRYIVENPLRWDLDAERPRETAS